MSGGASTEQEIRELSLRKFGWKIERRYDELEDLFDDELVFVHLHGHISSKREWIALLRAGSFTYDEIEPAGADVVMHGPDLAVLVGKARFTVNGGSVYPLVFTEIYARKSAAWKLVSLHTCAGSF